MYRQSTLKKRISRFQKILKGLGIKASVVSSIDNIFYLSGRLITEGCGPSLLFIPASGSPVLTIPEGEISLASSRVFPGTILPYNPEDDGPSLAAKVLKKSYLKEIKSPLGIEAGSISYNQSEILGIISRRDYLDIGSEIASMRSIKDGEEIELLRTAVRISYLGQAKAKESFKEGIDEISLQSLCRKTMEVAAGRPIESKADVLFGSKTSLIGSPRGVAGRYKAHRGDPAIVDFLPRVAGYFGDTTRTLWAGPVPREGRQTIKLLLEVKKSLENMLKPGVDTQALDEVARSRLSREGSFPHHTGHGIGISSCEAPFIIPNSNYLLKEGMTITLEPGLYFDKWGARIEDDYLITGDGFKRFEIYV